MQHTATYCHTLQDTATHCITPQHTTTHCNTQVFAYGQTGSGKTYTMEPIYAQTVREAFLECEHGGGKQQAMQLSVSFFEIYCSKVSSQHTSLFTTHICFHNIRLFLQTYISFPKVHLFAQLTSRLQDSTNSRHTCLFSQHTSLFKRYISFHTTHHIYLQLLSRHTSLFTRNTSLFTTYVSFHTTHHIYLFPQHTALVTTYVSFHKIHLFSHDTSHLSVSTTYVSFHNLQLLSRHTSLSTRNTSLFTRYMSLFTRHIDHTSRLQDSTKSSCNAMGLFNRVLCIVYGRCVVRKETYIL